MDDERTKKLLLVEQVNLLIRQTNMLLYLIMAVAGFFACVLMFVVPIKVPLLWLLSFYTICVARLIYNYYNSAIIVTLENVKRISWYLIGFSAVSGFCWGALGLILPIDDNINILLYVALVLCGMSIAPLATLSIFSHVYVAFAVPVLAPLTIKCIYLGGDVFNTVGIICTIFVVPSLLHSFFVQESFLRCFRLEFENSDLISKLTEEKQNAEDSREIAVEMNKAKTKFLAAASHDLRQPLHAMGFFIEALNEHANTPKLEELTQKIGQTSEALRGLLDSLLDISRIEAGVLVPSYSHFDLDGLLRDIHSEYLLRAEQKGIFFEILTVNAFVYTDQHMLERIVRNLVSNSMRYTEKGFIRIKCSTEKNQLLLEVSDSGRGIADDQKQKIFNEFYQIDNPERDRTKGIGLGLSIVDGLCRLLDLKIALKSKSGEGSSFIITVPLGDKDKIIDESELNAISIEHKAHIIVIDDEVDACDAMAELLNTWGYTVSTFEGREDTIAYIKSNKGPIDAILTDYRLRDNVTGADLIEDIHQIMGIKVPAVIITGDTDLNRLKEAKKSGFSLLHKPLQPAKLRSIISFLLNK